MEPTSAIAVSLALGASAAAGNEEVSESIKDAYAALKHLIQKRYPNVSIGQLERAPSSKSRRAVVEEDLLEADAGRDSEVIAVSQKLVDQILEYAPQFAGVHLDDAIAARVRLTDVDQTGQGVKITHGTIMGDISIGSIVAHPDYKPPRSGRS
jgi:hypothetical protein